MICPLMPILVQFFLHEVVFMAQVNIFLHKNQIEASILGIRSLLHGIEYVAYKI